jgi:FkbM family methyltransferase
VEQWQREEANMFLRDLGSADGMLGVISNPYTSVYFSQFGEDVILESLIGHLGYGSAPGFYVDVGAHHPTRGSNTHLLYLRGWRGVNIDGSPGTVALFEGARPHDKNVQAIVSDEETEVAFTIYKEGTLNTADPETKAMYAQRGQSEVVEVQYHMSRTLRSILGETVPPGQDIDVMNVDVEGFDLQVLRSNDWDRFAPKLLLVEDQGMSFVDRPNSAIFNFLKPLGYRLHSQMFITSIYIRDQLP